MNIFATVGTQLPFDRLVRCLDIWNAVNTTANVFAQIGKGAYTPANLEWADRVTPTECKERFAWADLVVAHAGIGTLLAAHAAQTPLVVMPRLADLGEHRNDHQVATARRLEAKSLAYVAHDENALIELLDSASTLTPCSNSVAVSPELLDRISSFVNSTAA